MAPMQAEQNPSQHDSAIAAESSLNLTGWDELGIAAQARDAAMYLADLDANNPAVLILKRVEVSLAIRALMKRESLECDGTHFDEQVWANASHVVQIQKLVSRLSDNQLAALKKFLGRDAELFLLGLSVTQRRHLAGALRRASQVLNEPIDRLEVRISRMSLRRKLAVGALAALAMALLALGSAKVGRIWQKPNLALYRPVKCSSVESPEFKDTSRLVDGDATNIGFHTKNEPNAWATIDLGESKSFSTVIVHNRADCCKERAVPLQIQVSNNGTDFKTIAEKHELFDKWVVNDLAAKGRYVRLQLAATNSLHLAEVEIY